MVSGLKISRFILNGKTGDVCVGGLVTQRFFSLSAGIKPMPILDPNASMNQQMNLLKSNILAAQQYISEAGGDEKALNKFLQEKFRGTLSDSSTVDASTDSDNLTDSNHTDSEMEIEVAVKKQKQYDERALRVPLDKGTSIVL